MKPRSLLAGVTLLVFLTTQGICPPSALALRVQNAGMEESPTRTKLERSLQPSARPATNLAAGLEEPIPREFSTYQERLVNQVNAEGNFKIHLDRNGFVETLDLPTATAVNTKFKLHYGGTKYLLLAKDPSKILLVETALKAFYVIDANDYRNLRSAGPKLAIGVFTKQIDPGPGMVDEGGGQEKLRDLLARIGAAGETAGFDITPLVYSGDVEPDDLDTALRGVVTIKMPEGESSIRVVVSQGDWVVSKLPAAGLEENADLELLWEGDLPQLEAALVERFPKWTEQRIPLIVILPPSGWMMTEGRDGAGDRIVREVDGLALRTANTFPEEILDKVETILALDAPQGAVYQLLVNTPRFVGATGQPMEIQILRKDPPSSAGLEETGDHFIRGEEVPAVLEKLEVDLRSWLLPGIFSGLFGIGIAPSERVQVERQFIEQLHGYAAASKDPLLVKSLDQLIAMLPDIDPEERRPHLVRWIQIYILAPHGVVLGIKQNEQAAHVLHLIPITRYELFQNSMRRELSPIAVFYTQAVLRPTAIGFYTDFLGSIFIQLPMLPRVRDSRERFLITLLREELTHAADQFVFEGHYRVALGKESELGSDLSLFEKGFAFAILTEIRAALRAYAHPNDERLMAEIEKFSNFPESILDLMLSSVKGRSDLFSSNEIAVLWAAKHILKARSLGKNKPAEAVWKREFVDSYEFNPARIFKESFSAGGLEELEESEASRVFAAAAEAAQGAGVVVMEGPVAQGWPGLLNFIENIRGPLARRLILVGLEEEEVRELRERNPLIQVIPKEDFTGLVLALVGLEEAEQVAHVGENDALADRLRQALPPSMTVLHVGPDTGLEELLRRMGVPDGVLDQINASGLEELFARSRAA